MIGVTRSSASLSKIRPPVFSRKAIPSRILASVLAPNPFCLAIAPLGPPLQVGEALDLQRIAQGLDLLGAESGHLEQGQDPGRRGLGSFSWPASRPVVASGTILLPWSRRPRAPRPECRRQSSRRGRPADSRAPGRRCDRPGNETGFLPGSPGLSPSHQGSGQFGRIP